MCCVLSDDDECVLGTDNCDVNAECTNTEGSFTCTCNPGFTGDGVFCEGIVQQLNFEKTICEESSKQQIDSGVCVKKLFDNIFYFFKINNVHTKPADAQFVIAEILMS